MKRIVCMGGGPAGLYAAILFKKALPRARVEVYERNRPDDTFGWGVVFSDQTMQGFRATDPESHAAIVGQLPSLGRHRRPLQAADDPHVGSRLLRHRAQAAAERAAGAGRRARRQADISSTRSRTTTSSRDADLMIAADGVNSRTRTQYAAVFEPDIDVRKCRFIWLGTRQTLPGVHVRVRTHRARLVPDPRLPVQQRPLDRHRRDARGDLARARARPVRHRPVHRVLRAAVRASTSAATR